MFSKTVVCVIFLAITSIYLIRCQKKAVTKKPKQSGNRFSSYLCTNKNETCLGDLSFTQVFNYLQKCGHISDEESVEFISKKDFTDPLLALLINETAGPLDDQLIERMRNVDCGGGGPSGGKSRGRRSSTIGKWLPYSPSNHQIQINYWVEKDSSKYFGDLIEKATEKWSAVTNVKFRRMEKPDISRYMSINITIRKIEVPFYMPHMFTYIPHEVSGTPQRVMTEFYMFPICTVKRICGDFKNFQYDRYNLMVVTSYSVDQMKEGRNAEYALYIFIHMWGHLLGLGHAVDGSDSVMAPLVDEQTFDKLSEDDLSNVQMLYGLHPDASRENLTDFHKEMPDSLPDFCDPNTSPKVDSILEMPDKTWIIFRDKHYFEVGPNGQTVRSPRRIIWDFKNFTGDAVEASFSWNDTIFLFFREHYWKYRNNRFIVKRKVSEGFEGVPDGPFDTAFVWHRNQKTYFFVGGQYWKYDSVLKKVPVNDGYPRIVADKWKGVPDNFDVAISSRHRNQTYFFYDMFYYKYDDYKEKVADDSTPPYPRNMDLFFFKCRKKNNLPQRYLTSPPPSTPSYDFLQNISSSDGGYQVVNDDNSRNSYVVTLIVLTIVLLIIGVVFFVYALFMAPKKKSDRTTAAPSEPIPSKTGSDETPGPSQTKSKSLTESQSKVPSDSGAVKSDSVKPVPDDTVQKSSSQLGDVDSVRSSI